MHWGGIFEVALVKIMFVMIGQRPLAGNFNDMCSQNMNKGGAHANEIKGSVWHLDTILAHLGVMQKDLADIPDSQIRRSWWCGMKGLEPNGLMTGIRILPTITLKPLLGNEVIRLYEK